MCIRDRFCISIWQSHVQSRSPRRINWTIRRRGTVPLSLGPARVVGRSITTNLRLSHYGRPAWISDRTSVSGQRSFAVLRSTCSWRVTTYVGKPSATDQPTRPTQPFILSGSINELWAAIRCSPPHSVEAPSGERLRRKGRHGVICR